jgi:hypothetical protein
MVREILSYFLHNPHAADSLEGVATWRLLDESVRRNVEDAREALAWLVSRGYLRQEVRASSGPIFTLNEERRREADVFLERGTPPSAQGKSRAECQ